MRPTPLQQRFTPAPLAVAAAMAIALAAGHAPRAHAQSGTAAAASTPVAINIPAQPLGQALNELARQANLQMTFPAALVAGKQAPAVSGTMTVQQALERVLAGSGLSANMQGMSVVVREATAPQAAEPTLPAVTVKARADRSATTENTGSYTTNGTVAAATGLALTLRETPQSVAVVTRQRMDDQALNSFDQVLEQVPGLYFWSSASGVGSGGEVRARGYPINSLQVDGVTAPSSLWGDYNTAAVDTAIYDSITVVRGATGLLTGAGDPSGSISLTRKRPTDTFQASVAQSFGRWNQLRSVADVGAPLNAHGSLRGRLVVAHDHSCPR
jgi:outer membrane receptor for ferric coprogen and ferric-rhodotorulic acid